MRIEYHRTLLADRVRNAAFHEALRRAVVRGKTTVADIGSGTGFLGFLAARLGARRVDLYERAEIAEVARRLGRHNRIRNCQLIPAHSTDIIDPERVDLVVSETLGNYPFEENIIETLNDARERFLKPGGVIIPEGVEQFACPVTGERLYRDLAAWDEVGYGLDFTPAKVMSLNNIYVRWFEPRDLLDGGAAARAWDKVAFDRRNKTTRAGELAWKMSRGTTIYGVGLWWRADLIAGVQLSTSPLAPRTHWEQLYLPALEPLAVAPGETLRVRLRSTTSYEKGTNMTWALAVADAHGRERVRHALDLEKGYLP
ncbi:MAG: methyltransferase [Hyphomicrobiaceae bacterium]|nr:MAG: methyltransferase [Hyphomicrobiaceae bacterium]